MRQAFSELFSALLAQCFPWITTFAPSRFRSILIKPPLAKLSPGPQCIPPRPKSSDSFLLHLQACPSVLRCPRSACCPSHPVFHLGMAAATSRRSHHPALPFPQGSRKELSDANVPSPLARLSTASRALSRDGVPHILHCPPQHPRAPHSLAPAPHTLSLSPLLPPFTCCFPSTGLHGARLPWLWA